MIESQPQANVFRHQAGKGMTPSTSMATPTPMAQENMSKMVPQLSLEMTEMTGFMPIAMQIQNLMAALEMTTFMQGLVPTPSFMVEMEMTPFMHTLAPTPSLMAEREMII